jgi:hypothetical protein
MLFEQAMKAHFDEEVRAEFPTLRRIPSSSAIRFLDYVELQTVVERDSLIDALARVAAMRFSDPAMLAVIDTRYRDAMRSAQFSMGLRYEGLRMIKAMLSDRQSVEMMAQVRSKLDFIPRDDFPVELVPDPDPGHLKPAKAPQLRKLIESAFRELFAAQKRKLPGGETVYTGVLNDTQTTVRIDYAGMGLQLRYSVTTPHVSLLAYEDLWGAGYGWDYLTEENAEASIHLMCELVKKITSLGLASRKS